MLSTFATPEKDIFYELEVLICDKFREVQEVVALRKDVLLSELEILREEHRTKFTNRSKSVEGLELLKSQMNNLVVRDNIASQFFESQLNEISKEIEKNRSAIPRMNLVLNCELGPLFQTIRCLGEIIVNQAPGFCPSPTPKRPPLPLVKSRSESINYDSKSCPSLSFALRGSCPGYLKAPRSVVYDNICDRIFVVDGGNHKIVMYSSRGDFISEFGHKDLRNPCGIAVSESHCYVTDMTLNAICKFNFKTLQISRISILNELKEPKGISLDEEFNELYVVDKNKNNCVWIYTTELSYDRLFDTSMLSTLRDIKVTTDTVFVLDSSQYCLHLFSKEGSKLRSIIRDPGAIETPLFFTLTREGNFILGGQWDSYLSVFSPQGKLLNRVGYLTDGKECPTMVRGVCITSDDKIVCGFYHGHYAMKMY
ncbi:E3 ubiquitin-protein ligase TRIM71-like [Oopsacas minuta]|uniref:E3 ubiquitin-protein ligase TRIM71-like n=1 Tax=Oopsacas minuta TaxID=111878 RepID=A0AAV7JEL2_9METZ|nr:E3 ubiquitin-protein ligase TRIM71-like [Oopsacas minuta]